MFKFGIKITLASMAGLAIATASVASASAATKPKVTFSAKNVNPIAATHTTTTRFSLVPDSGYYGNPWAEDTYTAVTTVTRAGGKRGYEYSGGTWHPYPVSDCGGGSRCYLYTWSMKVTGTSETIAGNESPNAATVLDVPEYVTMSGTATGHYFSSYKRYYTADVPTADDLNGNLALQSYVFTSAWVAQGSPGAHTADLTDTDTFNLAYTAGEGYGLRVSCLRG